MLAYKGPRRHHIREKKRMMVTFWLVRMFFVDYYHPLTPENRYIETNLEGRGKEAQIKFLEMIGTENSTIKLGPIIESLQGEGGAR